MLVRHDFWPSRLSLGSDDSLFQTHLEFKFKACIASVIRMCHVVERHAHGAGDLCLESERYLWKMLAKLPRQ
jgi:hypothetical protein